MHKFHYSGLQYEVASCILSNDICWISGPYLPGDDNDISIFRKGGLIDELEPFERVEADDGYIGEAPQYVRCPKSIEFLGNALERKQIVKRVQGRIEVLNRHTKFWETLGGKFPVRGTYLECIEKHQQLFTACMVVKQVAMELGYQLLWDADTETIKYDDTQVNYDNAATAEVLRQTNKLLDAADTALIDRNQLELMLHPFF